MAQREDLIVDGYFFGSFEDADAAVKELKNTTYLNERTTSMNKAQLKAVYDKMLDEKVFKTPVGWEYLKKLKKRLMESGYAEEDVRPIPIYVNFGAQKEDDTLNIARQYVRPSQKRKYTVKDSLRISIAVNILLVILVLVMFFITLKSDNPNILNYKEVITNQYASWEQELTEREKALREKEAELENSGG